MCTFSWKALQVGEKKSSLQRDDFWDSSRIPDQNLESSAWCLPIYYDHKKDVM